MNSEKRKILYAVPDTHLVSLFPYVSLVIQKGIKYLAKIEGEKSHSDIYFLMNLSGRLENSYKRFQNICSSAVQDFRPQVIFAEDKDSMEKLWREAGFEGNFCYLFNEFPPYRAILKSHRNEQTKNKRRSIEKLLTGYKSLLKNGKEIEIFAADIISRKYRDPSFVHVGSAHLFPEANHNDVGFLPKLLKDRHFKLEMVCEPIDNPPESDRFIDILFDYNFFVEKKGKK